MKALILAAGRGERMRPLTDHTPKPLLRVGGRSLIEHHIRNLARAGVRQLVINVAWLGERIVAAVGDGSEFGVQVEYSREPLGALETGGGIFRALPLLGNEPFAVVNGDIWTDYPFAELPRAPAGLAHLVLVDNPEHHQQGDFGLREGRVHSSDGPRLTFSGIGLYRCELFRNCRSEAFPLAPLLRAASAQGAVTGARYTGLWHDIGTPARLARLQQLLASSAGPGR